MGQSKEAHQSPINHRPLTFGDVVLVALADGVLDGALIAVVVSIGQIVGVGSVGTQVVKAHVLVGLPLAAVGLVRLVGGRPPLALVGVVVLTVAALRGLPVGTGLRVLLALVRLGLLGLRTARRRASGPEGMDRGVSQSGTPGLADDSRQWLMSPPAVLCCRPRPLALNI